MAFDVALTLLVTRCFQINEPLVVSKIALWGMIKIFWTDLAQRSQTKTSKIPLLAELKEVPR